MKKDNKAGPGLESDLAAERIVPILEEKVTVGKRRRVTGSVMITKKVHEREEWIDEPLVKEEVIVDRVPINKFVDGAVSSREEDGVTIIPVLEEIVVVEKKLLLKEELHIRKKKETFRDPRKVLVRSEEVQIERSGPKD